MINLELAKAKVEGSTAVWILIFEITEREGFVSAAAWAFDPSFCQDTGGSSTSMSSATGSRSISQSGSGVVPTAPWSRGCEFRGTKWGTTRKRTMTCPRRSTSWRFPSRLSYNIKVTLFSTRRTSFWNIVSSFGGTTSCYITIPGLHASILQLGRYCEER